MYGKSGGCVTEPVSGITALQSVLSESGEVFIVGGPGAGGHLLYGGRIVYQSSCASEAF